MSQASHSGGAPRRFLLSLVLPLCLPVLTPAPAYAGLEIECGFGKYIKTGHWFPVIVSPVLDAQRLDVYAMEAESRGGPKAVAHFRGAFRSDLQGKGFALCKFPNVSGNRQFIRCQVLHADGSLESKDVQPSILNSGDTLALILSERPETFEFLGSLDRPERGIVRVVACGADDFPSCWQELNGLDEIILDGTNACNTVARRRILEEWVISGGTVLLTSRALSAVRQAPELNLFPEALGESDANGARDYATAVLAPVLGKQAAFVGGVRAWPMRVDLKYRILSAGEDTLLAGKDIGRGRVLALGVDWPNLALTDRAAFEMVRRTLWGGLLDLRRPVLGGSLSMGLVLPREARAGYLVKRLGLFLLAYVILLGPVNWLILRKLKRLEYSTFTLPVGALVFAVGAFFIGVSLRSTDTILEEAEVVHLYPGHGALLNGMSGLLAPDRRPYHLTVADAAYRLEELQVRDRYASAEDGVRPEDLVIQSFGGGCGMFNVKVGTWRMRFFETQAVTDLGRGFAAVATCDRSNLYVQVENRLPSVLKDAWLIQGWNTLSLGDLPPQTARTATLALRTPTRDMYSGLCPNCHRYHGRSLGAAYLKDMPHDRLVLEALYGLPNPVILGWLDAPTSLVAMDRARFQSKRRRLCVVPVDLRVEGPDIRLPACVITEDESAARRPSLERATCADIPYLLEVADLSQLEERGSIRSRREAAHAGDRAQNPLRFVHDFRLPFIGQQVASSYLRIFWDAGDPNPDSPPQDMILSIYDWQSGKWEELRKAQSGEQTIAVTAPGRFVRLPYPVVRLRVAPGGTEEHARVSYPYLGIEYEGRRTDGGGNHAQHP